MFNKVLLSTAVIFLGTTAGFAQGFTGAELGIEYSDSPDVDDFGGVNYFGSAEFALAYGVSAAISASSYNFDVGESDISNLTAHFIFSVDPATSIGLFIGQDYVGDENSDLIGAEFAYDFGLGDIEAYFGSASDAVDEDVTIYGAAATYELGSDFSFVANLDGFSGDGFSSSAFEVGGYYQLAQGPRFGATIGQLNLDSGVDEVSELFFGIQASIAIGPDGGTTFGRRGAFEVSPAGPPT